MSKHAQRKGRISSKKIGRLALVGLILAIFALGATAAVALRGGEKNSPPQPSSSQVNDARTNSRFSANAQPLPLSPQTGQVRPLTQEEAERLAANIKQLVNQSTDGLKSVQHADGTVSMDLQGRFQHMAVTKRDENGEWVESCVDNPEAAAVFFGIDPQLVGVKKSATATRVTPNANSAAKGEVR